MITNSVRLIGHLGDDPKIITTDAGLAIGRFPLATNNSYTRKDTGERITDTEWHNLVCFGKGAEILEKYTKKGSKIAVEGSIHTRSWEDDNGIKKYRTEIKVNEFHFLSGASASNNAEDQLHFESSEDDDDLPF